jgi:hypothetical protein
MKTPLEYYHDEQLTKRYEVNENGFPIVDFGEIIPGKRIERTIFVTNTSKDKLVLRQPFSTSEELSINDYPPKLLAGEKGIVKLIYNSDPEKIESHHATWGYEVIVG